MNKIIFSAYKHGNEFSYVCENKNQIRQELISETEKDISIKKQKKYQKTKQYSLNFGRMVKKSRELKGWSLSDLASQTKITVNKIKEIENGETDISLDMAFDIMGCLDISLEELGLLIRK